LSSADGAATVLRLILTVSPKPPTGIVLEVRGIAGGGDHMVDHWVEPSSVLGDFHELVFKASELDQILEVVRVLVDVRGAHVVATSFEALQCVVLLVFLDEPKLELLDKGLPGSEREGGLSGLALCPPLRRVFGHEGHCVANCLLLGRLTALDECLREQPHVSPDGMQKCSALRTIAVEDKWGVRSEDRFCGGLKVSEQCRTCDWGRGSWDVWSRCARV
jgi:hypothetical protein